MEKDDYIMTNFLMDSTNLQIFDENGKLVTEIKDNIRTHLLIDGVNSRFSIENCSINLDLLKSLGENKNYEELSDFESSLNKGKSIIKFKNQDINQKFYKIISKGIIYDTFTEAKSHNFNIILHNVVLASPIEIDAKCAENFTPQYTFYILEDKDENFVDLELLEV